MQSLSLINGMYKDINEIVDKQGQTLTRIEDNTVDTKDAATKSKIMHTSLWNVVEPAHPPATPRHIHFLSQRD